MRKNQPNIVIPVLRLIQSLGNDEKLESIEAEKENYDKTRRNIHTKVGILKWACYER